MSKTPPKRERWSNPDMDALIDVERRLLPTPEHPEGLGFVKLLDYMGGDESIVYAARQSHTEGTKQINDSNGVLRYLVRHYHCYHAGMQVLTLTGWRNWEDCAEEEDFLIPDPTTRTLRRERLRVATFDFDGELHTYENNRMSYAVTPDHRMYFKPKGRPDKPDRAYGIHLVQDMPHWGWFDPLRGYTLFDTEGETDPLYELVGFFLGDGHHASPNRWSFNLRKLRKRIYLEDLLHRLGATARLSPDNTREGVCLYSVPVSMEMANLIPPYAEGKNRGALKAFAGDLGTMTPAQMRGLWRGLVNSDGSVSTSREQIHFSSTSPALMQLFEALAAMQGYDAHAVCKGANACLVSNAYTGARTTLQSRAQYHSRSRYCGKVYCATSSTGLLMVRGSEDTFAFVCGNTSPIEFAEISFQIRAPILVARHIVRHRTANWGEESARFSILKNDAYIPPVERLRTQGLVNKQGSDEPLSPEVAEICREYLRSTTAESLAMYEKLLGHKLARETARDILPLSIMTTWCWKIDAHNLLKFLRLRSNTSSVEATHTQDETAQYADAIADYVAFWIPWTWAAARDYWFDAIALSRLEWQLLQRHAWQLTTALWEEARVIFGAGELREFRAKADLLAIPTGALPE